MTRGVRSRPLVEPPRFVREPSPIAYDATQLLAEVNRDEKGRFTDHESAVALGKLGGRPRHTTFTEWLRDTGDPRHTPEALAKAIWKRALNEDDRDQLVAAALILNRVEGMPRQALDLTTPADDPIVLAHLAVAQKYAEMARALAAVEAEHTLIETRDA